MIVAIAFTKHSRILERSIFQHRYISIQKSHLVSVYIPHCAIHSTFKVFLLIYNRLLNIMFFIVHLYIMCWPGVTPSPHINSKEMNGSMQRGIPQHVHIVGRCSLRRAYLGCRRECRRWARAGCRRGDYRKESVSARCVERLYRCVAGQSLASSTGCSERTGDRLHRPGSCWCSLVATRAVGLPRRK